MAASSPLRIGYDAHAFVLFNKGSGKGLQLRNLLGDRKSELIGFAPPGPSSADVALVQGGSRHYLLWQQKDLPRMIKGAKLDIFLAPYNTAPLLLPRSTKLILVLHDLIPFESYPEMALKPRLIQAVWRFLIRRAVQRAHVIVTVSEYSRMSILARFPDSPVKVIPCTIEARWFDPGLRVEDRDREDYVLLVSSIEPHRNLDRMFAAFALYLKQTQHSPAKLRIAGVSHHAALVREKLRKCGIDRFAAIEEYLPDAAMEKLVRQARALCLPSLTEGFGIPILEAMSAGTPVLTSKVTSMPEIGADAPEYFDPYSIPSIANALLRVLESSERRAAMSRAGIIRAMAYHPEKVTLQIRDFWESVETAETSRSAGQSGARTG